MHPNLKAIVIYEGNRPKRRLEVKGQWPRGLAWPPWLPAGAAGRRPLLRELGPTGPAGVPAAVRGGGGSARPTLQPRCSRFHKPPEQPLGPSSTRKRNSISVLLDSPGPGELSVALLRPWLSITEVWLSREFFCLYEEKSDGERTLTGCLTNYFQIGRFVSIPEEPCQARGETDKRKNGCRISDNLVTGYHLCKHSPITEVAQEELRPEERGILQNACTDGVTQLESKDVILMQNVPGEKNCQWHKNGRVDFTEPHRNVMLENYKNLTTTEWEMQIKSNDLKIQQDTLQEKTSNRVQMTRSHNGQELYDCE
ncbi:hypothetical protein AB1E18_006109 [Capra hircus]